MGNTPASVSVDENLVFGATLDLGGQAIGAIPLAIAGTGVGGLGALVNNNSSAASYAGPISVIGFSTSVGGLGDMALSGGVGGQNLTKLGGNTLTLSGTVADTIDKLTVNSGTVVLAKTNTIAIGDPLTSGSPCLVVNGGVVQLGGSGGNQIFDLGAVVVTSGAFDTNGRSETFLSLSLQGTGIAGAGGLVNSAAAASTITPINGTTLTANATIGVTLSGGSLTLNNPIGGNFGLTKVGAGTLTLADNNIYSGGTNVTNGTLNTTSTGSLGPGPLTINAANGVAAAVNLGNNQMVSGLSGTIAGTGAATLSIGSGVTLTDDQSSGNTAYQGVLINSGTFTKSGTSSLELNGNLTLNANSTLLINRGTLRFNVSGAATIGTGVTASVAAGATLELAGSVSALSSGGNRVHIVNDSTASGLVVSGTHQVVGGIDGVGNTQVNAGSDLTANYIIQSALVTGGTAKNPGLVTIDASDASGNPLGQTGGSALAGSLTPTGPIGAGGTSSVSLSSGAGGGIDLAALSLGNSPGGSNPSSIPEPSTLALASLRLWALLARSSCDITLDVKPSDPLGRSPDVWLLGGWLGARRGICVISLGRGGPPDEWHLNLGKPFGHLAFDLSARFSQVREFLVISFPSPRLVAIRAIGDAVGGDGVEQDLVQA